MSFAWLKRYMPRSLFGRTALILLLPVATVVLVVSVIFVQRHFEDGTRAMTREVARALNVALDGDAQDAAALAFTIQPLAREAWPDRDMRRWYDVTGSTMMDELRARVPGIGRIELPDDRRATLYLTHADRDLAVRFSRSRASPENPHQLLVWMGVLGAVITLISALYLRNQVRPISRLAAAAEAFGRGRTTPYSPSGALEVRAAGQAFLSMRQRIERQIEQRTLMLSGVSHDMRTPLTRMRLGLAMLDDADRIPLERDVDDMQRLVDAFLAFARGEAEAGEPEPTDPSVLVRSIVETMQRGEGEVVLREIEGEGMVSLRPHSISRAVENLIANAVRYGTRCEVSVSITPRALRIRVEDDGPGIAPEDRETAVRPFVRLDPARNQDRGSGVGLGLSIAADIARSHGGALRLGEGDLGGLRADIVLGR